MANTNSNSKIALYLPMIGGNSSTTTKDYSVNDHTVTFNGNAVISKDQFYDQNIQSSLKLDGSGDYVSIMHSNSIEPENCDFTLILKVYPTATTRDALYASQSDYWFGLDTNYNVTRNVNLWASSNGSSWDMISGDGAGNGIGHISMNLNEWNNIRVVRKGNRWRTWINNVLDKKDKVGLSMLKRIDSIFNVGISWLVSTRALPPKNGSVFFRKKTFNSELDFNSRKIIDNFKYLPKHSTRGLSRRSID